MNDFTKEELEEIYSALGESWATEAVDKLTKKVQSLIDNYCEHKWRESPRLKWLYDCIKCRKEKCKVCGSFNNE